MELLRLYKAARKNHPKMSAKNALQFARLAEGSKYGDPAICFWGGEGTYAIVPTECTHVNPYNPPIEGTSIRWVEDTVRAGLRLSGYADKIVKLNHTGWFEDDFSTVLRGAVWQLPSRKGQGRFVYGYEDPENEGAAKINFEITDCPVEAAYAADRFAQRDAEENRHLLSLEEEECEQI